MTRFSVVNGAAVGRDIAIMAATLAAASSTRGVKRS